MTSTPSAAPASVPSTTRRERVALLGSAAITAVMAAVGVVWGILAGSGAILFDGLFTTVGVGLVSVSMVASRAASSAPTSRYPFGRHAATPLAVTIRGAALLAMLLYGMVDAIAVLSDGGSQGDTVHLIGYGVVSAVACTVAAVGVRRLAPRSGLAEAEAVAWRAGAWLAVVLAVGGVVGTLLERAGHTALTPYVDPALVVGTVLLLVPLPVRLIREGAHELLDGTPPPGLARTVRETLDEVRRTFDLPEPELRLSKVGRRMYVDIDVVVPVEDRWTVADETAVRRELLARLTAVDLDVWATVELSTPPGTAEA